MTVTASQSGSTLATISMAVQVLDNAAQVQTGAASATTLTNARAALVYANALTGKNGIVLVNFGADYSTNNGVFAITWSASST